MQNLQKPLSTSTQLYYRCIFNNARKFLLGTNPKFSHTEIKRIPNELINALQKALESQRIKDVNYSLNNIRYILPQITKQVTRFNILEPMSYSEMRRYYSEEQIQGLLQKIYDFVNHLLKSGSTEGSKLLDEGLNFAFNQCNEMEIKLKRQFGLIQLLTGTDCEEVESFTSLLEKESADANVSAIEMAALRNLQGFVATAKALKISNEAIENKIDLYKKKNALKFYKALETAKFYFHEAGRLDPKNRTHKINEMALDALHFGIKTPVHPSCVSFSKSGTIKVLPTLIKNIEETMRYREGDAYTNPQPWIGIETLRRHRRPLNAIVFDNLIELHKQSILESLKPAETKLALLSSPSGMFDPAEQVKEAAKESKRKRTSKKTNVE